MKPEKSKVVVDSNIWISYILGGLDTPFKHLLKGENIQLISSPELKSEIFTVLSRPKFKTKIKAGFLPLLELIFDNATTTVEIKSHVNVCRDPKDNYLLALCKDGNADFLITGDDDLLAIENFEHTMILKLSQFISNHS